MYVPALDGCHSLISHDTILLSCLDFTCTNDHFEFVSVCQRCIEGVRAYDSIDTFNVLTYFTSMLHNSIIKALCSCQYISINAIAIVKAKCSKILIMFKNL